MLQNQKIPDKIWWEQVASFKNEIPPIFAQKIDLNNKKFVLIDEISKVPTDKRKNYILLFFADDKILDRYYKNISKKLEFFNQFYAVCGMDFSTYPGIDEEENIEAIKKNRRFCVLIQKIEQLCIYNAVWTGKESYDIAFNNIKPGGTVVVSTFRIKNVNDRIFSDGYTVMKERCKPSKILCYGGLQDCMKEDEKSALVYPIRTRFEIVEHEKQEFLESLTPSLFD